MNMHNSTKIGLAAVAVAGVATVAAAPGAQAAQDCKTTTVTSQVKVADAKKTTKTTPAVTHVEHTDAVTRTVVDKEAYDEKVEHPAETHTVEHPAETHVVHHEAVTHEETVIDQEAVQSVWANFQPNDHRAPFVGPPSYPTDPRGSWINHGDVPPGHAGSDGVYSKGNPDIGGNWFYRQAAVDEVSHVIVVVDEEAYDETVVDKEAWTETVVDKEAWTETVHHEAVTRTVEVTPASDVTVVDSPASSVTVVIPAVYETKTNKSEKCAAVVKDASTKADSASTKAASEVPNRIDAGLAGNLPNTGGPNGVLLAVGGLLAGIGGIGAFLTRRRKNA